MSDVIHLLPDSIANQIAAGEVIQRPASLVKELVENSLDAGATNIQIVIKDAGRTLVQIIDNGKGMSNTDVRMAFERHATSKISNANDLFALQTMGFRGEALASIAAISHLEVKTKRQEDEIGTLLQIEGSQVQKQEAISCNVGTTISVKNIFFNVPARRKFLKSNETERRNIFTEIERMVLVNPHVEFTLIENDITTLQLPIVNLRQRIAQMAGKNINQQLIEINEETTLAKIYGYISMPQYAKKSRANQFFFVNNRYIRHPYFHRAVMMAYEPLISSSLNPNYFIYFEVNPSAIDVNIHPTKTEVKFEEERALWQILMVMVKESLGKSNAIPAIDFDTNDAPQIPIYDPSKPVITPQVSLNSDYNPFKQTSYETSNSSSYVGNMSKQKTARNDWETFYKGLGNSTLSKEINIDDKNDNTTSNSLSESSLFNNQDTPNENDIFEISPEHYQYKNKYILTSVKSGLMIIDQNRAHSRILFDKYLEQIQNRRGISQRVLFPEILELSAKETTALNEIISDLEALGFNLSNLGNNTFAILGLPSELKDVNATSMLQKIISQAMETGYSAKEQIQESLAQSLANASAIPYGRSLSLDEMLLLVSQLFACHTPNHTADGRTIISVVSDEEIEKRFSRKSANK